MSHYCTLVLLVIHKETHGITINLDGEHSGSALLSANFVETGSFSHVLLHNVMQIYRMYMIFQLKGSITSEVSSHWC